MLAFRAYQAAILFLDGRYGEEASPLRMANSHQSEFRGTIAKPLRSQSVTPFANKLRYVRTQSDHLEALRCQTV